MQEVGFIVPFWEKIFSFLSRISVFYLVRKFFKNIKNPYSFVEKWVLGNAILSIICSVIAYNGRGINKYILGIIVAYSIARIFEIIVYQINVLIFDKYRAKRRGEEYRVKSITRMVILLMHNYVEIIFWYASLFMVVILFNEGNILDFRWGHYIKASILCITTYDNGLLIKENYTYLMNTAFFATISGFIMTAISIARFIGLLPSPEAIDEE